MRPKDSNNQLTEQPEGETPRCLGTLPMNKTTVGSQQQLILITIIFNDYRNYLNLLSNYSNYFHLLGNNAFKLKLINIDKS